MRLRWAGRGASRKLMRLKMSLDKNPLAATAEKFEEAYFMDPASGSAYHVNNYLETALLSRAYFEMAEIIARCFKPQRVLEVGCAAGPSVYHLNNYFDTEAHGVDVSAWAVKNRLHPNVGQATAGNLPFPDGHFDVVFSCHMLEHLTPDTVDQSIREMTRVCGDDGLQFHLLPILGSGPYKDIFGSIVGLRKDQTHNLLHRREWWIERWEASDWRDTGLRVGHAYDNHGFEFSDCQFILSRKPITAEICRNVAEKNLDVARAFQNALVRRPPPGLEVFLNDIRDNWK
jgi:cyclopropane fatty-acyl-phospholipid synthase-like methyltransferase